MSGPREVDWKVHRVSALNDAIGSFYREDVLAVGTFALRRRMDSNARKSGADEPRWYHETLQSWGRAECPRLLFTGGKTLEVSYSSGRWSWRRISKRVQVKRALA